MNAEERKRLEQDILRRRDEWINSDDEAPAEPVDVLKEKNERIAALEVENEELRWKVEAMREGLLLIGSGAEASIRLVKEKPILGSGQLEGISIVAKEVLEATQQPTTPAAPVAPASDVTLSESEIDWLAQQRIYNDKFYCWIFQDKPASLNTKLVEDDSVNTEKYWVFRFSADYDTPANRAAIAARREALGLK